ncbi:MAG: hypothetical protein ACI4DS_02865 [Eubacterium sp.]
MIKANTMKKVYIVISKTHTKFGWIIRKVGKVRYNHAAIALDKELEHLYSFARPKHHALLLGRLVEENIYRYTLGKYPQVEAVIFQIEVSDEKFEWMKNTINNMLDSKDYLYNLFSVLSSPITGGFSTYKAFSCIEFVMYILKGIGYRTKKPLYCYRPDDLLEIYSDSVCYKGNLLEYNSYEISDSGYYEALTGKEIKESFITPVRLFYRLIFKKSQSF